MLGGVFQVSWRRLAASWSLLRASWRRLWCSSSRLRDGLEFLADFSSELEALWRRPGPFLELPWTFFSESGKRLGRDITLSVYFEEVRSRFRGRFVLISEVKTERSEPKFGCQLK